MSLISSYWKNVVLFHTVNDSFVWFSRGKQSSFLWFWHWWIKQNEHFYPFCVLLVLCLESLWSFIIWWRIKTKQAQSSELLSFILVIHLIYLWYYVCKINLILAQSSSFQIRRTQNNRQTDLHILQYNQARTHARTHPAFAVKHYFFFNKVKGRPVSHQRGKYALTFHFLLYFMEASLSDWRSLLRSFDRRIVLLHNCTIHSSWLQRWECGVGGWTPGRSRWTLLCKNSRKECQFHSRLNDAVSSHSRDGWRKKLKAAFPYVYYTRLNLDFLHFKMFRLLSFLRLFLICIYISI